MAVLTKDDGNQILAKLFSDVFRAFEESSDEVQAVIRDMVGIINNHESEEEEKHAALATLTEALFPSHHNGELGIGIEDMRDVFDGVEPLRNALADLDREQQTFAERLAALIEEKGLTQTELAARVGVKQPAISMMLKRSCRPQQETLNRMVAALGVSVQDLWPS